MTTKKSASKKKLPELTIEDVLRQAITLVVSEEEGLDLGTKEKSILVRAVLDDHGDGIEAVIRGHMLATFFDLFSDDEDEDDEDEDDEDEDDEDDEDEDEDE